MIWALRDPESGTNSASGEEPLQGHGRRWDKAHRPRRATVIILIIRLSIYSSIHQGWIHALMQSPSDPITSQRPWVLPSLYTISRSLGGHFRPQQPTLWVGGLLSARQEVVWIRKIWITEARMFFIILSGKWFPRRHQWHTPPRVEDPSVISFPCSGVTTLWFASSKQNTAKVSYRKSVVSVWKL